ncbi:two-component system, NtrC family, sensor histidine kinase AtoS [Desulfotomaculum arcticum]|uniref:histidine kinase n=1 Tax=Desulfotruncus arcticus DSM 17038 TaxID=1121424 RepID=A0A1I2U046_9FIRM|nr:two-component system sensor histidine kinase AtoS [Desulfotruncus arcticus]SFG70323.1 two-component system, NtrC family, sensor histidine kinase AtoS [Desulfotomaculum arcticum] [Desulfotruncus arcticus DSM 17038]
MIAINIKRGFINQLLILIAVLLLIPIILAIYLFHMVNATELGMIQSHQKVLEEAMDYLDDSFGNTSFEDTVKRLNIENLQRRDQEKALNQALKPIVDGARKKYPELDIGFYSKSFDVILDGNNDHLHENFSTRRKRNFDDAMESEKPVFEVLGQPGSGQLETYRPLMRDGKIIGAVWANENINQIYKRIDVIQKDVYGIILVGVFLGFGGAFSVINKFVRSVDDIKEGLETLGNDPTYVLPKASGELGQITDAVNAMFKKLIDVQQYNDLILTSIDDGTVSIDINENIINFNPAAARILSLDNSCLGRKVDEVFNGSTPFAGLLKSTLDRKPVKDLDVIYDNTSERSRHLLISTSLMINVRQELVGALLHCRDITEIVRLQESVSRQERLASLGKLVAGVAHEIRSPLTSVTGYMQFWNKGHAPSAKSLNIVNRELRRLATMTDQLLEFARPSKAVFTECDLNGLINRSVQFFADAHGGDVQIYCQMQDDLPPAYIDPHQIEQVLSNIMYNAYQAMESGRGILEITTWHEKETGMLGTAIKDNGCGMSKEVLEQIFEPFFTTKAKGTGLGMAIAHEIIKAHKGSVLVESEPNRGTTIKFLLPEYRRGDSCVEGFNC